MVPVTDLPRTPLAGDLVVLELLEPDEIADMLAEPPRRRDEWHPDFPREDDRDGVRMVVEVTGGARAGSCAGPTAWWSARSVLRSPGAGRRRRAGGRGRLRPGAAPGDRA